MSWETGENEGCTSSQGSSSPEAPNPKSTESSAPGRLPMPALQDMKHALEEIDFTPDMPATESSAFGTLIPKP